MIEYLQTVLAGRFLLIQIGDYGQGYENESIPKGLEPLALEREQRGERTYPKNPALPPPHFHVPADLAGILMNKTDELRLNNGLAYWAQQLRTRVDKPSYKPSCVNSCPAELLRFSKMENRFWAVLVTTLKKSGKPNVPKGSIRGRLFERWTPGDVYVRESPTYQINKDIVYTEADKATLLFDNLETLRVRVKIDLNEYHVFFTSPDSQPAQYRGKMLPYRSSNFGGTCSLLMKGRPDKGTGLGPLQDTFRIVVALATIHPHVCGRVRK